MSFFPKHVPYFFASLGNLSPPSVPVRHPRTPRRGVGLRMVRIGPGFQLGLGAFQASERFSEPEAMGNFDIIWYNGDLKVNNGILMNYTLW